ncbi:hypothetical protein HYV86_00565 [Candidatus Woesearchaeota archaeon]|nr:hypothetical protein [Candidatus Woesearchaeota archaeon]
MVVFTLEIVADLEQVARAARLDLNQLPYILNLPDVNVCEKRSQYVFENDKKVQACRGCVTSPFAGDDRILSLDQSIMILDFAKEHFDIGWITINGYGDPLSGAVMPDGNTIKQRTIAKIQHAARLGVRSYVFNAGDNLDPQTADIFVENGVNVMWSLFGNKFVDADFFGGREYDEPLQLRGTAQQQNPARIAANLRDFISTMNRKAHSPKDGITRLGMNYVFTEHDRENPQRVERLSQAAQEHGIAFMCNTPFGTTDIILKQAAKQYVPNQRSHSTSVYVPSLGMEQCQMGAGAVITVGAYGNIGQCPYVAPHQDLQQNGNIVLKNGGINLQLLENITRHLNREYLCLPRGTR